MTEIAIQDKRPFRLRSVYVRESECKFDNRFDPLLAGQAVTATFSSKPIAVGFSKYENKDKTIQRAYGFITEFECRYTVNRSDESEDFAALIRVHLSADYFVNDGHDLEQEFLEKWHTHASLVHLWPYWREHCHDAMVRMAMPVVPVPFLELIQAADLSKDVAAKKTIASSGRKASATSKKKVVAAPGRKEPVSRSK